MAFGIIVVTVLGGAVVFDRSVAHKEIAQPAATATTAKPESSPSVAEATSPAPAIKLADAGKEPSVASMEVEKRSPAAAPTKSSPPKRQVAMATTPTAPVQLSTPAPIMTAPPAETTAPAPAPAAAATPASPPSETPPAQSASSQASPSQD